MNWQEKISREITMAHKARRRNNEGLARVCARRASGWAIQQYLRSKDIDLETPSAFEYIIFFRQQHGHTRQMGAVLDHMVQRMVKDSPEGDAYWPLQDVDLIQEAEWLIQQLLGDLEELDDSFDPDAP